MQKHHPAYYISMLLCAILLSTAVTVWQKQTDIQAQVHVAHQASICTDQGLTGPAQQENLLYCPTLTSFTQYTAGATPVTVTDTLAPSTYQAAIDLAQQKHIIVGTPTLVTETVDWSNCQITYVEFSSGYHAEHHNTNSPCAPDLTVRYYSPTGQIVWP